MKRCLTLCAALLAARLLFAQANLQQLEYFFDNDPGFGHGTPMSLPAVTDLDGFSFPVSTTDLTEGFHWCFVRVRDAEGRWSETQRLVVLKISAPDSANAPLTALEYFYDFDPGFGAATRVTLPANQTGVTDFVFSPPTTEFLPGFHWLFVRVKDSDGKWSETQRLVVFKPENQSNASPPLTALEYFYDFDPGFGAATRVTMPANQTGVADFVFSPPATELLPGFHWLFVRVKDSDGKWSETQRLLVYKDTIAPQPDLAAGEYFFDTDPGFGQGHPIPFTPVTELSDFNFPICSEGLAPGAHRLFVRVRDADGKWSETAGADMSICLSGGSITGNQFIPFEGDPAILQNAAPATVDPAHAVAGVDPVYIWQKWTGSTPGCDAAFVDIPGANGLQYDPPAGLQASTWYRRLATYQGNPDVCSAASNIVLVEVAPDPNSLPPANDNCSGAVSLNMASQCAAPTTGSTFNATRSVADSCLGAANDDVWYRFTATHTAARIQLQRTGLGGSGIEFQLFEGNCQTLTPVGNCQAGNNHVGRRYDSLSVGATYYLRVYTPGYTDAATFEVCVFSQPVLNLSSIVKVCNQQGGSLTVGVSGGLAPYQYTLCSGPACNSGYGAPQGSPVFANLAAGYYTIRVNDANGATDTVQAQVGRLALSVAQVQDETCPERNDGSLLVQVSQAGTAPYVFSIGGNTPSNSSGQFGPLPAGTYTASVTDALGCVATVGVVVGEPAADPRYQDLDGDGYGNIAAVIYVCDGQTPAGYVALSGDCNDNPAQGGAAMYPGHIEVCDGLDNDCDGIVDNGLTPVVTLTASVDTLTCAHPASVLQVQVQSPGNYTYLWSNGASGPQLTATVPGTYTVVVSKGAGCSTNAGRVIFQDTTLENGGISSNPSHKTINCQNPSVQLNAFGGVGYRWNTAATSQQITVYDPGYYSVSVSGTNGCIRQYTTYIDIDTVRPRAQISGPDRICYGNSVMLSVDSQYTSVTWSNGQTGTSIQVSPLVETTYIATVSNPNGCFSRDTQVLSVVQQPAPGIAGNKQPLAFATGLPETVVLSWDSVPNATAYQVYYWYQGSNIISTGLLDSTVALITVPIEKEVFWTVTSLNDCAATPSDTLSFSTQGIVAPVNEDCAGATPILVTNTCRLATLNYPFSLSGAQTGAPPGSCHPNIPDIWFSFQPHIGYYSFQTPVFNGNKTNSEFIVELYDGACNNLAPLKCFVNTQPYFDNLIPGHTYYIRLARSGPSSFSGFFNLKPDFSKTFTVSADTTLCAGGTARLHASGGSAYLWWDNSVAPEYTITPSSSITPWVIVYNQNCSEFRNIKVSVIDRSFIFPNQDSIGVCEGSSLPLKIKNATSAVWSSGQNGLSIQYLPVADRSLLKVTAHNDFCVFEDSIVVNISKKYPTVPALRSPVDSMDLQEEDLFFEWEPSNGADAYDLYVWKEGEAEPENPVIIDIKASRVFYSVVKPVFNAKYFWRVAARNSTCSVQSDIGVFRMKTLPDLEVIDIQVPNHLICGEDVSISYTVRNNGPGYTGFNKSWYDKIYFSDDTALQDSVDAFLGVAGNVTALYPGQTYRVTARFRIPIDAVYAGQFYIIVNAAFYKGEKSKEFKLNQVNTNNDLSVSAQKITVVLPDESDLQVSHATCPINFFSKSKIPLQWTVRNAGPGRTNKQDWSDRVLLVKDTATMANPFILGGGTNNRFLYKDSIYTQIIQSNKIPANFSGAYFVVFEADARDNVWEYRHENNNRYVIPVDIILSPAPDLVSRRLLLPDTIYYGIQFESACTVANEGFSAVEESCTHTMQMPRQSAIPGDIPIQIKFSQGNYLNAGDSVKIENTTSIIMGASGGTPQPGIYTPPLLRVDSGNSIFEHLGEDNNDSTYQRQLVLAPPDLIVATVNTPTPVITAGDLLEISYEVTNAGHPFFHAQWKDEVYFTQTPDPGSPKILADEINVNNNDIFLRNDRRGQVARFALPCNFVPGTYYCWVKTDIDHKVTESDDANNQISVPLLVEITPGDCNADLLVKDLEVPANLPYCSDFTVKFTVQNVYSTPVVIGGVCDPLAGEYGYLDLVALRDDTLRTEDFDFAHYEPVCGYKRLLPGDTLRVMFSLRIRDEASAAPGHYRFMVRINANSAVQEINYDNNYAFQPVFLDTFSKPDLVIRIDDLPSEVISGQAFTLKINNRNKGSGPTVGSDRWSNIVNFSPVPYNLDDPENTGDCKESYLCNTSPLSHCDCSTLTSYQERALLAGDTAVRQMSVSLPANTPTGLYYLIATTDPKALICEMREDNNQFVAVIRVRRPDPGDLVVENVALPSNTTIPVGTPFIVRWKLKNQGQAGVNGDMREAVYLSRDPQWSPEDLLMGYQDGPVTLGPGMDVTRQMKVSITKAAAENYYLIVRTDVLDNIWETSNHNNEAASDQTIGIYFPSLPVGAQDTVNPILRDGQLLYYRIDIKPEHLGQTIEVRLSTPDSVKATNQIYLRRGILPSFDDFEFRSLRSDFGNQQAFIPTVLNGTYFLMVEGHLIDGDSQLVHLEANIVPFSIRSVQSARGGNNGFATLLLRGARFDPAMQISLRGDSAVIAADSLLFIDGTRAFARFDLRDKPLGYYTVSGLHPGGDTTGWRTYEIVAGGPPNVAVHLRHPQSVSVRLGAGRPGTVRAMPMTVEFENLSTVDIPIPLQPVRSLAGAPLALTSTELPLSQANEILVPLRELEGPGEYLRAGAKGSVLIWVNWGTKPMVFLVENESDEN